MEEEERKIRVASEKVTFTVNNRFRPRGTVDISDVKIKVSIYRGDGNTTRAIDAYVQQLFDEGMTCLVDPYEGGRHKNANEHLVNKFKERIRNEHTGIRINYLRPSEDTKGNWYAILCAK